jgi:hypothetical protein
LIWLKPLPHLQRYRTYVHDQGISMRRFGMKALFTILTVSRPAGKEFDWDRIVIMASTMVTVGLVALYVYGKATSRW